MPVATQGSVKAVDTRDLRDMGAGIVLGNTYHLYLRPGVNVIERLGGLHGFMGWDAPILTDSGGFQGFSLKHLRKITEDAIVFKSHVDGSTHTFTPEAAVEHQQGLGADIIMPLDVCPPATDGRQSVDAAARQTTRWAERSKAAHTRAGQMLFGIVQGGLDPDLRERSVGEIAAIGFPGYAIGGLSVGEPKSEMHHVAGLTAGLLPEDSPRYLMGVGSPEDLVECVARGRRHVRLRAADAHRPQRRPVRQQRQGERGHEPVQDPRAAGRPLLHLLHLLQLLGPLTCTTCSGRRRYWRTGWLRYTTCNSC